MIYSSQCFSKAPPCLVPQRKRLNFRCLDRLKIRSLGIFCGLYETIEHFMHQISAINSPKLFVAEHPFCMAAEFQSVAMPNINSSTDASR